MNELPTIIDANGTLMFEWANGDRRRSITLTPEALLLLLDAASYPSGTDEP
jgi:hypothetical protein